MSRPVITIAPEESLAEARGLMVKHEIRRLPVVEDGRLVGIVSDRDVRTAWPSTATTFAAHELGYLVDRLAIREVMQPNVLTVTPYTRLEEAARLLRDRKIGGLPVVSGAQVVGIITETDIFRAFQEVIGSGWGCRLEPGWGCRLEAGWGCRLEVELGPGRDALGEVLGLLRSHGAVLVSLDTLPGTEAGGRTLDMTVKTGTPDSIVSALERSGHKVLTLNMATGYPTSPAQPMVLVVVDGTAQSEHVVRVACRLASEHGVLPRVLLVVPPGSHAPDLRIDPADPRCFDEIIGGLLAAFRDIGDKYQVRVDTEFRSGDPMEEVRAELAHGVYSFVIVGKRSPHHHLGLLHLDVEKDDLPARLEVESPVPVLLVTPGMDS
ncbi:MAG: CBS domain-containing protein [Deltaproteobacteria bacterium]|nr:CBS domain-containing protein [Deltaproteobacteria bacterium]MBI3079373.1 CBS domain-containing protein [Deltaproteobacteria bacterium]